MISGFLITTLLLREREKFGRISLRYFYIRRALRIWPLYYATAALYVAVVLIFERGTGRAASFFHYLPAFLTYTYRGLSPHHSLPEFLTWRGLSAPKSSFTRFGRWRSEPSGEFGRPL